MKVTPQQHVGSAQHRPAQQAPQAPSTGYPPDYSGPALNPPPPEPGALPPTPQQVAAAKTPANFSGGGVAADLTAQVQRLQSSATDLSGAIDTVATLVSNASTGTVASNLTTQLQRLKSSASQLSAAVDAVNGLVGGSGSDVYANVSAVNTAVGGSGSTVLDNATAVDNALLTSPTGTVSTDLATGRGMLVNTPAGTLEDDVNTLRTTLGNSAQTILQAIINTITTSISAAAASLQDALNTVSTLLFGNANFSTSLQQQALSLSSQVDGGVLALSGFTQGVVTSAAAHPGGNTVNLVLNTGIPGQTFTMDFSSSIANGATFTFDSGPNSVQFVNQSGSSINSVNALVSYLTAMYPVGSVLVASVAKQVNAVNNMVSGNGNLRSNVMAVDNALLISPTGVVSTDLSTARGLLVNTPGQTLEDDVQTLSNDVDTSASTLQNGLNNVSTQLFGNANFSSSLAQQVENLTNGVDSSVVSLPGSSTYVVVGSGASGAGNIVSLGLTAGNFELDMSSGPFSANSSFTLTNTSTSDTLTLTNKSGSTISSTTDLVKYLAAMYPPNSKISYALSDQNSAVKTMLGGTSSDVRSSAARVDASILQTPTGVISSDLSQARSELVNSQGTCLEADIDTVRSQVVDTRSATFQNDVTTVNSTLNASASGSTQSIIGAPIHNSASASLADIIGGTDPTLAAQLGDPQNPTTGLSALISAPNATAQGATWPDLSGFTNAFTLNDQLQEFLALFSNTTFPGGTGSSITFSATSTAPSSLAELLNNCTGMS